MELATYSNIKTKLYNDLDLYDEDFITEAEFLGILNEGIDTIESVIHNLGLQAKYFLNTDTLSLVSGTADYSFPSDIYATKFVKVIYVNGEKKYEISRIRDLSDTQLFTTGEDYQYLILNLTAGYSQRIYPTPAESGAYVKRFYIRNVRKLTTSTASTNTCELPECVNFLYQFARVKIWEKEGSPLLTDGKADLKTLHDLMVSDLQEMVPDEDNKIHPDLDFYTDGSMSGLGGY